MGLYRCQPGSIAPVVGAFTLSHGSRPRNPTAGYGSDAILAQAQPAEAQPTRRIKARLDNRQPGTLVARTGITHQFELDDPTDNESNRRPDRLGVGMCWLLTRRVRGMAERRLVLVRSRYSTSLNGLRRAAIDARRSPV
jgi:hypothetical protein